MLLPGKQRPTSSCTHSTFVVHNINGATTYNDTFTSVAVTNPPLVGGSCTDWCNNYRKHWIIFPYVGHRSIAITVMTATLMVLEAEELAFTIEKEAQFLQQVYRNVG